MMSIIASMNVSAEETKDTPGDFKEYLFEAIARLEQKFSVADGVWFLWDAHNMPVKEDTYMDLQRAVRMIRYHVEKENYAGQVTAEL